MNTRQELLRLTSLLREAPMGPTAQNIFSCIDVWERGQSSTATAGELRVSVRRLALQAQQTQFVNEARLLAATCCLGHAVAAFIMTREPLAIVLLERCKTHIRDAGKVSS
jgi:hypothetical protein